MAQVLLVGIDPEDVDLSDPALPAGMTAEIIRLGIARALEELREAGHDARHIYIPPDVASLSILSDHLARESVDCVVIGGGVRLPPRNLVLFEAVLNVVTRAPSQPVIALIARPEDAVTAAARVLRTQRERERSAPILQDGPASADTKLHPSRHAIQQSDAGRPTCFTSRPR